MAHAFASNRAVTPQGTQSAALLVDGGTIHAILSTRGTVTALEAAPPYILHEIELGYLNKYS